MLSPCSNEGYEEVDSRWGVPWLLWSSSISARHGSDMAGISPALRHHTLGIGNRARRVEPFRASLGAVHDGVAAIETERVLEPVEALAGALISAVGKPAVRLQQDRWAKIAVLVPPVARTRGRAAEAEDALPRTVELCALLLRLAPLA